MPEAAFVLSAGHDSSLPDLVRTLRYELELQAVPSIVHVGTFPEPRPDRVYVLLDPWTYLAEEGESAMPDDPVLSRTIFLLVGGLPGPCETSHRALLERAGDVFVCDQRARVALERLDIYSRVLRPGYSAALDRFDREAPRPIDIAFIGAYSPRRSGYLAHAAPVLARHNSVVHLSDPAAASRDGATLSSEERCSLLCQTKVLINLHHGPDTLLEWRHVVDAIHTGAVIVTEHSHGIAPLVQGEHLLVASADSLPFVAERLLADHRRLSGMRQSAYDRLRSWIPYAFPVSVLRAAMVELVGEPVPASAALGVRRAPAPARHVLPLDAADPPTLVPRQRAHLEVLAETPGWARCASPEVSVIVAADGDPAGVAATLGAVAVSRFDDFEVVIADAGADAQIGEATREWMDAHPYIAARLVSAPDPALGVLRNAAVDGARGQLCLVLDAGSLIYPRGVDVLVDVLRDDPDLSFAYPIQDVAGDHLTSYRRWHAWLLHRSDDLRAPALIRADRLRDLGGFTTEGAARGHEDLDLWSRMAARGWRGELVPQPVARRLAPLQS